MSRGSRRHRRRRHPDGDAVCTRSQHDQGSPEGHGRRSCPANSHRVRRDAVNRRAAHQRSTPGDRPAVSLNQPVVVAATHRDQPSRVPGPGPGRACSPATWSRSRPSPPRWPDHDGSRAGRCAGDLPVVGVRVRTDVRRGRARVGALDAAARCWPRARGQRLPVTPGTVQVPDRSETLPGPGLLDRWRRRPVQLRRPWKAGPGPKGCTRHTDRRITDSGQKTAKPRSRRYLILQLRRRHRDPAGRLLFHVEVTNP